MYRFCFDNYIRSKICDCIACSFEACNDRAGFDDCISVSFSRVTSF